MEIPKVPGINVALYKPAIQSSTSRYSRPHDSQGAVSGIKTGSFNFCTDYELNPWWQVDLEEIYAVHQVRIFNREDAQRKYANNAKNLFVYLSIDGFKWQLLYHNEHSFGGFLSGDPLIIDAHKASARFVRIQINGYRMLALDQVEVYASTYANSKGFYSQLGQDEWVLQKAKGKKNGYFVEFGATNGIELSNTYLLEKDYNWTGVCADPNPIFFEELSKNRKCITTNDCIYSLTGETVRFVPAGVFGTIEAYLESDHHADTRKDSLNNVVEIQTISLNDLLEKYHAPKYIDYISIDTEGSEYEILKNFDFSKYTVHLFTIEHNFTENRQKIYNLLSNYGYQRIEFEWDDWYYLPDDLLILRQEASTNQVHQDPKPSYTTSATCDLFDFDLSFNVEYAYSSSKQWVISLAEFVQSLVTANALQQVPLLSTQPDDYEGRIKDVLTCPFNQYIPRVEEAGHLTEGIQTLHNGIRVYIDSYCPELFVPMLYLNSGVHEPEEEAYFLKILELVNSSAPIILELGSYWAFYSMWFLQTFPSAKAYMIEPDAKHLFAGQRNFQLNGFTGDWTQASIGQSGISIDEFAQQKEISLIDILHSDIQGAEFEMLEGAKKMFESRSIVYTFISTHSQSLHQNCLEKLLDYGYHIIYSADLQKTRCCDGVIIASEQPLIIQDW